MPLFLGIHKITSEVSESDIVEGFSKYKERAKSKGLNPLSAVYSIEKGFAYCQTEADNAQQVRQAHEDVAIPLEDVVEVKSL